MSDFETHPIGTRNRLELLKILRKAARRGKIILADSRQCKYCPGFNGLMCCKHYQSLATRKQPEAPEQFSECKRCDGLGTVMETTDHPIEEECHDCEGEGKVDQRGFAPSYSAEQGLDK